MCKKIDSEVVLKSYFRKYSKVEKVTYATLNNIRKDIEEKMNAYIDITYTSLNSVERKYPEAIVLDDTSIQLIDRYSFCKMDDAQDSKSKRKEKTLLENLL